MSLKSRKWYRTEASVYSKTKLTFTASTHIQFVCCCVTQLKHPQTQVYNIRCSCSNIVSTQEMSDDLTCKWWPLSWVDYHTQALIRAWVFTSSTFHLTLLRRQKEKEKKTEEKRNKERHYRKDPAAAAQGVGGWRFYGRYPIIRG